MHIVAFCARKGGTGKSTLALQLAGDLAARGQQVVLALPCSQLRGGHNPCPLQGSSCVGSCHTFTHWPSTPMCHVWTPPEQFDQVAAHLDRISTCSCSSTAMAVLLCVGDRGSWISP